MSRSSIEYEYPGIATIVEELELTKSMWVHVLLPMTIRCPIYHTKTKHVAIDLHFVREMVEDKTINVEHISSKNNGKIF